MNKTVLVTGVTGAIGKATALELAKENCRVILLGRNAVKLSAVKSGIIRDSGNNDIEFFVADLSEPGSVKQAAQEIKKKYSSLNALINVAAIFKSKRIENSLGYEYMFATNHLGPFILTNELTEMLKAGKSSKVITVSAPSFTKINFDDLHGKKKFSSGFTGAFGASKMMNLLFTYSLARRLGNTGITANVFHPGLVRSDLTKEMPAFLNFIFRQISGTPDKAARMLCRLALDEKYATSNGTFFKFNGKEMKSNDYSHNQEMQDKLWKISEQLAG
ncbi:MAG: SDR family NAD(P)-dependent oxidoreductase [Bacteroidia bacterium]